MTDKQRAKFYFPAWNRCVEANEWFMVKGRFTGKRAAKYGAYPDVDAAYQSVWRAAEALALQHHRAITAEDLRHACHVVALGKDKSSKTMTNAETDRVVSLIRLMTDPDDLDAVMAYSDPTISARQRLLWVLDQAPMGYVAKICESMFGTADWSTLEQDCLSQLAGIVRQRRKAWNQSNAEVGQSGRSAQESKMDCPF